MTRIDIASLPQPEYKRVLTGDSLEFVASLVERFSSRRDSILKFRADRQAEIDAGRMPDFLRETEQVRRSSLPLAQTRM